MASVDSNQAPLFNLSLLVPANATAQTIAAIKTAAQTAVNALAVAGATNVTATVVYDGTKTTITPD